MISERAASIDRIGGTGSMDLRHSPGGEFCRERHFWRHNSLPRWVAQGGLNHKRCGGGSGGAIFLWRLISLRFYDMPVTLIELDLEHRLRFSLMVVAYHLIWTVYGSWLPNDLLGSGSRAVVSLAALGDVHFGRKRLQPHRAAVREFYADAEPMLVHPVMRLDAQQRATVGACLGEVMAATPYTCWACAVMADHVHLVMRKHRDAAEEMIERLQEATRSGLNREALVAQGHPVWTVGGWKTFLDSADAVRSCVRYVEGNPERERMAPQAWPYVVEYDGWPFRPGGLNRKR
jgi:REP element-mobilizing transposase RayT